MSPSRSRSACVTDVGSPTLYDVGPANVPFPRFVQTETAEPALDFAARSGSPSPSKSAEVTERAKLPVAKPESGSKHTWASAYEPSAQPASASAQAGSTERTGEEAWKSMRGV